jgi:uncharacterized membrane protein YeaQ/YmgE (transglycosylase-associated protein family)
MNLLSTLLTLAITGLIIGGLARLFLPGSENMGIFGTILAGIGGSFVGGLIVTYLLGTNNFWITMIVAVACACLFILPFRMYYAPTTVVVPRRSFFGRRTDYVVDDGYGAGYARRPFWRRRGLI